MNKIPNIIISNNLKHPKVEYLGYHFTFSTFLEGRAKYKCQKNSTEKCKSLLYLKTMGDKGKDQSLCDPLEALNTPEDIYIQMIF
jgi:hypothetical protein